MDLREAQDESLADHRAALSAKLEPLGMVLIHMPADNNCQFHAICDQLTLKTEEEVDHIQLRREVIDELRKNEELYSPFLEYGMRNGYTINDYNDYLAAMALDDVFWGDNTSLQAIANMRQVRIVVHSSLPDAAPRASNPNNTEEAIEELHIAHVPELHYDSTRPVQLVGNTRPPPGPDGGAGAIKRPRTGSSDGLVWIHEDMEIDSETDQAIRAAVRKQGSKGARKGNPTSIINGLLYCDVPVENLDANLDNEYTNCMYHIAIGTGDISLTYSRLKGGDGLWRLWPVLEKPGSTVDRPLQVITKKPLPRRTWRKNARFKHDLAGRPALPKATSQRGVPIKLHLLNLHGKDYGCCFPHTLSLLPGIIPARKDQASSPPAAELLAEDFVSLDRLKLAHHEFCEGVRAMFLRQKIDADADISRARVNEALADYDRIIERWSEDHGDFDSEKAEMDAADRDRHQEVPPPEDRMDIDDYWASSFKTAVHEGARQLLARVFDRSRPIEDCLVDLFRKDEARAAEILADFGIDEQRMHELGIASSHVMGEALELLYCYLSSVRKIAELRDYLAEQQQYVDSDTNILYKECEVVQVFMSSAPHGSPFRMTEEDRDAISAALGNSTPYSLSWQQKAEKLAKHLYSNALKDRFFDVLVWLKDEHGKAHFQVAQCKARKEWTASMDISKYAGRQFAARQHGADALGSLMCLEWVSNVFHCKQTTKALKDSDKEDGDFVVLCKGGFLQMFLFDSMRGEAGHIFDAADKARVPFDRFKGLEVPETSNRELRDCQKDAVEALKQAREDGFRGGTIIAATGSGKSITAFVDALATLEEQGGDMPLLWTCPRIFLLTQSALGFAQWERIALKAAKQAGKSSLRYYYLVCSADDISTPALRVITNAQVLSTMLRHKAAGTLGQCRFFSTVEGSGGFWNEVNKFTRVTQGSGSPLDDPVFGVFVRDEVHVQCGPSCAAYSLGLNIPARWYVSYTATPSAELTRKEAIKDAFLHVLEANGEDPANESDSVSDDADSDGDEDGEGAERDETESDEGSESDDMEMEAEEELEDDADVEADLTKRAEGMKQERPEEIFPDIFNTNLPPNLRDRDPALVEAASSMGLKGLQLLSDNLQFVSLEHLVSGGSVEHGSYFDLTETGIKCVMDVWKKTASTDAIKAALGRQVVLFPIEKELTKGMCTCSKQTVADAGEAQHDPHCASKLCNAEEAPKTYLFRASYSHSACNFRPEDYSDGNSKVILQPDCIVLGIYRGANGEKTLCIRNGPARGLAVHDSTEYGMFDPRHPEQRVTNLVGKALHIYTFADAFASEEPILAKPALAVCSLDPLALPLGTDPAGIMHRIHSWLGISREEREGPDGAMESGIVIKNLSKVMLQITFGPDGRTVINASAHEYASAALLLRLYEDGCVTKVIAFCPTIAACRRVMALFKAMVSRRISELKEAAEDAAQTQLDILRDINCGHVHQSESKDGEIIRKQARHVRQQLIGQFLTGQFEVLFNTNLLSTGVDFPCCDAVLLISPTKDPRTIMQRWGRALRYVACKPNKKGILAMVSTDPYEPSEDIEEREEALGISDDTVFKNDQAATEAQFDAMYRVAECAVDPSRRTIGVIFRLIGGWIQAARTSGSKGSEEKKQKQKSLADILLMAKKSEGTTLSLTPQHEQLLGRIFKAHTVRLVADPLWWWNDLVEDLARWRASNPNEASPPANQGQYGVGDKLSKARGRLRDIYSILESKGLLYPDTTAGIAELERALKESKGGNLGYVVPTKNLVQKIEDTLQDKKWWHRMTVEEKFKAAKKKLKDWNSSFSDRYKEVETGKLIGKERSNPVGPDEKPPAIFNLVLQKKDVKAAEEIARKLKEKQYSELLTEDERREISRLLFFEDADVLVWQNTFDSRTAWARLAIQLRYWKRYKMWCDGVFLDNNEPPYILKTRDERDNEWFGDIGRKFKEAMGVCGTFKGEGTLKKSSQFTTEPTEEEIESIGIALGIDEAYNWWDEEFLRVEEKKNKKTQHKSVT